MTRLLFIFGVFFVCVECSLRHLDGKLPMLNGKGMPLLVDVDVTGFNQQIQDIISKDLVEEIKGSMTNFTSSDKFKEMVHKESKREIEEFGKKANEKIQSLATQLLKSIKEDEENNKLVPAFGVTLTKPKVLASNEIVKFDKVWTNVGDGYSTTTGVFTAPRSGVYHVSCTALNYEDKALVLHLMKNKIQIVVLYVGDKGYSTGSINMVLQLETGDTVYMEHPNISGQDSINSDSQGWTMFSGYFISK